MAKLGDVCEKKIDTIKSNYKGMIDYIDIASVDNQKKIITSTKQMAIEEAPSRAKQLVFPGDILVSMVRPNLNAVALVTKTFNDALVASTGYCVLRCLPNVDTKYVFYFCQSSAFVDELIRQATGASYPAVTANIVKDCFIPLPALDEQRHIATVLDKVTDLISQRRAQLDKLDLLVKSRFVEMFGDPEVNSFNLPSIPMTNLCEIIDGDRGSNYPKQEEFSSDGYCLFLNAKNVTSSGFCFNQRLYISKEKDSLMRKGKLQRGDIVLTTRGTIGNLAFYDRTIPYENVRINSGMVILRLHKEQITETFFIQQFKMLLDLIKSKIASGSAQPQLPISTMKQIMMLVPQIEEQKKFNKIVAQTNILKSRVTSSLDSLETLKKLLMQQYFE